MRRRATGYRWAAVGMALGLAASAAPAGDFRPESAGVRTGFTSRHERYEFRLNEVVAAWPLPGQFDLGGAWRLRPRLEASAGCLSRADDGGFVAGCGPGVALGRAGFPAEAVVGVVPTYLNRHCYPHIEDGTPEPVEDQDMEVADDGTLVPRSPYFNFGSHFAFTSYAGLHLRIGARIEAGYRYEHLSNAGIGERNPGRNFHMLSLLWRFR